MARTLEEARDELSERVSHVKPGEFSPSKLDQAIRATGEDMADVSSMIRVTTGIPVAGSAASVDITGTVTDFIMDDWIDAFFVDDERLQLANIRFINRKLNGSTPGQPLFGALLRDDFLKFVPANNATARTLNITHVDRFTSITIGTGTPEAEILNIPEKHWHGFINGCLVNLLHGLDQIHPEVATSRVDYKEFKKYITTQYPRTEVAQSDYQSHPSRQRAKEDQIQPV